MTDARIQLSTLRQQVAQVEEEARAAARWCLDHDVLESESSHPVVVELHRLQKVALHLWCKHANLTMALGSQSD